MISALSGDGVDDLRNDAGAGGAAQGRFTTRRPDVGCADAASGGRDHPRKDLSQAASGTAVSVDGRDRQPGPSARTSPCASSRRSLSSARASARSCSARAAPPSRRSAPMRARSSPEIVGGARAPVPVREGARELGRRSGPLPRNGTGIRARQDASEKEENEDDYPTIQAQRAAAMNLSGNVLWFEVPAVICR